MLECNQIEKIKRESLLLGGEKQLLLCHMSSSPPQQRSRLHWHARHITVLVGKKINLGLGSESGSVSLRGLKGPAVFLISNSIDMIYRKKPISFGL